MIILTLTLEKEKKTPQKIYKKNYNLHLYYIYCKDTIRNEPNCVGFAREKAQTMSFVERGFERLGPDDQVMGFSRCSYKVK